MAAAGGVRRSEPQSAGRLPGNGKVEGTFLVGGPPSSGELIIIFNKITGQIVRRVNGHGKKKNFYFHPRFRTCPLKPPVCFSLAPAPPKRVPSQRDFRGVYCRLSRSRKTAQEKERPCCCPLPRFPVFPIRAHGHPYHLSGGAGVPEHSDMRSASARTFILACLFATVALAVANHLDPGDICSSNSYCTSFDCKTRCCGSKGQAAGCTECTPYGNCIRDCRCNREGPRRRLISSLAYESRQ